MCDLKFNSTRPFLRCHMFQLTVGRYNRGPRNILQKLFFAEGTFNGTGFVYRTGHTVSRLISTANPATNFRVRVKPRELGSPSQRAAGCVCPVSGFWSWHCLVRWRNSPTVSRPHFSWPACSMFATLHVCRIAAVAFGFASGLLLPIVWGFGFQVHPQCAASANSADAKHTSNHFTSAYPLSTLPSPFPSRPVQGETWLLRSSWLLPSA